jgi:hypothetical protein
VILLFSRQPPTILYIKSWIRTLSLFRKIEVLTNTSSKKDPNIPDPESLGSGNFGSVYKVGMTFDVNDSPEKSKTNFFAFKVLSKAATSVKAKIQEETWLLQRASHANILTTYGVTIIPNLKGEHLVGMLMELAGK